MGSGKDQDAEGRTLSNQGTMICCFIILLIRDLTKISKWSL